MENIEPRKIAAYLCLHMGLMLSEVAALRFQDIDLKAGAVSLNNIIARSEGGCAESAVFMPIDMPRTLPMPSHVKRYIEANSSLYPSGECFILSGSKEMPAFHFMQNILSSISNKYRISDTLSAMDLRNAFIRRCIQSGMDLYSLCAYVGIKQPNVIVKRFGEYFTAKLNAVNVLEQLDAGFMQSAPKPAFTFTGPKLMNLLVLGAGSQGSVVKETAEAVGVFNEIAYLDDDPHNKLAIGPLSEIVSLVNRFPMATASFGDSILRQKYMDSLESLGYIVPTLIHPSATISPSASVARSVLIEARSIISASAVLERGVLVSSASVIEVGARVGQFAHIGSSVTVAKNAMVQEFQRVPSGIVIRAEL